MLVNVRASDAAEADRAFCFCKQKTAYEMRISDWSSDVCSSDLLDPSAGQENADAGPRARVLRRAVRQYRRGRRAGRGAGQGRRPRHALTFDYRTVKSTWSTTSPPRSTSRSRCLPGAAKISGLVRSEERRVGKGGGSTGRT